MYRRMVRRFIKKNPEYHDLESYLMMALLKKWHNLSYRGMVDELNCNKPLRKKLGFRRTPPKSTMWWNVRQLPIGLLDELVAFTAGKAARGMLLADSSSYTYDRYERVGAAKSSRWERSTVKYHVLLTMDGCVAALVVTDGDRDDCSVLPRLTGTVPTGSGYLLADRKYCSHGNCQEALRMGRLPCMRPPEPHRARARRVGQHGQVGAGQAGQLLQKVRHAQPRGERLFVILGQVPQPHALGDAPHAGARAGADVHLPQPYTLGIRQRAVPKWHIRGGLRTPGHIAPHAGIHNL